MRVAIVGCVHGQLSKAYAAIRQARGAKPDFVIMCGDIQACRTAKDMESMSVPQKYRRMGDFHEYFSGNKVAPYLTVVVGGNHEASAYMSKFSDRGGWLARNIWYVGDAGLVEVGGLRIAGLSGVWYEPDYEKPRFEPELFATEPAKACQSDARFSVYHTRKSVVEDLVHRTAGAPIDIVVTHDWPRGIENFGDTAGLLSCKPWFRKDIETSQLGNPATAPLLDVLKPQYWLSAHLHVQFTAKYNQTQFIALDKILPGRKYLQFINITPQDPHNSVETAKQLKIPARKSK